MPVYCPDERLNNIETKPLDKSKIGKFDDNIDFDKTRVECICPKCGKKHVMNFHWIGRGTPRKFCPLCKE
jgi:hypothetical protein